MARDLPDILSPEAIGVASVGLIVIAGALFAFRSHRRRGPTPEQIEARRRSWLAAYGKLSGGEILDVQEANIAYTYDVRGINYSTTQDVASIGELLPRDRWSLIGAVGVKYDPRNPANSIIVAETWSGIRR